MKTARCLVFSRDVEQFKLVGLTLREYGLHYRVVETFEMLGPLSESCPTLAWLIDLDGVDQTVTQITAMARRIVPDSKIVFLSSRFTAELAQECLRERAATLLVKPIQIPRLVQCISSFRQEPELLDQEDYDPESTPTGEDHYQSRMREDASPFRVASFTCPVCATTFDSYRFNSWHYPVKEVESDFCPIYPRHVLPEIYLVCVCPKCFYANQAGRFEKHVLKEKQREVFLEDKQFLHRQELAGKHTFTGERGFTAGFKSFELAEFVAMDLAFPDYDAYYGELLLKSSWLCRRMGKEVQEREAQRAALQHYIGLYRPYERRSGVFRRKSEIMAQLPRGKPIMPDRTIIFTGFLVAELSRRLGLVEQAKLAFSEVSKIPFLSTYPFLSQHVQKAAQLLESGK